jgi:WD40 repeat protein
LTRRLFTKEEPKCILKKPLVDESWSPLVQTLEGVSGFKAVAFSHESKSLASISADRTISVWDVATGLLKNMLGITARDIDGKVPLDFSYDSRLLASSHGEANDISIWDVVTGNLLHVIHSIYEIENLAFTHDSKTLLATSRWPALPKWLDTTKWFAITDWLADSRWGIQAWETETWKLTNPFQKFNQDSQPLENFRPSLISFSPDSLFLALGTMHEIKIWDASQACFCKTPLSEGRGDFCSIDFSHDSGMLACGTSGGAVLIWNTASWDSLKNTPNDHRGEVYSLKFAQDSRILYSASKYDHIKIRSTFNWSIIKTLDGSASIQFALSHDLNLLASVSDLIGRHFRIWDMAMLLNEPKKSHVQPSQDQSSHHPATAILYSSQLFSTDLERVALRSSMNDTVTIHQTSTRVIEKQLDRRYSQKIAILPRFEFVRL